MERKARSRRSSAGRALAVALAVAGAPVLAGCSASTVADHIPTAAGGLPEGAPQRPAAPAPFPAVHDVPPPRAGSMLSDEEQRKLEADLIAARERAAGKSGKPAGGARNP